MSTLQILQLIGVLLGLAFLVCFAVLLIALWVNERAYQRRNLQPPPVQLQFYRARRDRAPRGRRPVA